MRFFRLAIFCGAVWLGLGGADSVFAQKKRAPQKRPQTKSRAVNKSVKKPATPPPTGTPLIPVTRLDFAGLQALLKREPSAKRPLLINFWATWCTPCVEEFPELVKIDQDYRSRGLEFVTISLDDLAEINRDVPKFLAQMKAEMPAFLLKTADEDAAIQLVAPDWRGGLPFTVLFDASGKIAYSRMGLVKPEILRSEIEKVLVVESENKSPISKRNKELDDMNRILRIFISGPRRKVTANNHPPVIESIIIKKQKN